MASNNYKDPFKKLLANIKASAKPSPRSIITAEGKKLQGVEVNGIQKIVAIDAEDLKRKFDEQEGFCFWTGIPLNMDYINESYHKLAPSVDRLDENKGYTYDNIVITVRFINFGRGNCDLNRMLTYMKALKNAKFDIKKIERML
tara:strand:+ start:228 stop:659 length:432 start_codon:yes stop_codon:yes gene_type:complete